jgi:hypothetical protein
VFGPIRLFDPDLELYGAIYETAIVVKRDPRCNFMENFATLRFSVGMFYAINLYAQMCKWIKFAVNEKRFQNHDQLGGQGSWVASKGCRWPHRDCGWPWRWQVTSRGSREALRAVDGLGVED